MKSFLNRLSLLLPSPNPPELDSILSPSYPHRLCPRGPKSMNHLQERPLCHSDRVTQITSDFSLQVTTLCSFKAYRGLTVHAASFRANLFKDGMPFAEPSSTPQRPSQQLASGSRPTLSHRGWESLRPVRIRKRFAAGLA